MSDFVPMFDTDQPVGDLVISLSGGKDSTATYLDLLERGVLEKWEAKGGRVVRVFADTGWELPETYAYVNALERRFGKVNRVAIWVPGPSDTKPEGFDHMEDMWVKPDKAMAADRHALAKLFELRMGHYSAMVRLIMHWMWFPMSKSRWCTDETKKRPLVSFMQTLDNPINVIGIRAEESASRAKSVEYDFSDDWDCHVWRPILGYKLADVIAIHNRHGIAPNPLYLQGKGSGRVGCAPCVNSGKPGLLWLAAEHPDRAALLGDIESAMGIATGTEHHWFAGKNADGTFVGWPIKKAIEWAQTGRGGRQHILFRGEDEPGCTQWGLCEAKGGHQ
jgi:3'-phosphoadenosine 5'-phosphosulfate sulfotransferase (PAPS reductase)/FAD synthetase